MIRFRLALGVTALASLSACHESTATPDMSSTTARCTMPTAVPCTDESIQQLSLKKPASARSIVNTPDGTGFLSEIDATGGAGSTVTPTEAYLYAKFTDVGLMTVSIGDEGALTSMDWDVAFRRFIIRLNSGVSGPSCVDGARTAANTDYDALAAEPAGLDYRTEQYFTPTCDYVPDGSGLMSPGTALQSFWSYPGCLQMTGNVFVLRLADGRRVKLVVTHYYEQAVQDYCDANNMIMASDATKAAHLGVRWAVLGS